MTDARARGSAELGGAPRLAQAELDLIAEVLDGDSDLAQAYEMSWLACRMIAERYGGPDTLIAFYRAVGSAGGAAFGLDQGVLVE